MLYMERRIEPALHEVIHCLDKLVEFTAYFRQSDFFNAMWRISDNGIAHPWYTVALGVGASTGGVGPRPLASGQPPDPGADALEDDGWLVAESGT